MNDPLKDLLDITNNKAPIGENTFLKLREEKLRLKEELETVKNQRDRFIRKMAKILTMLDSDKDKAIIKIIKT